MISDVLAKLAVLDRKVDGIDDVDAAVEAVVDNLDRDLTDSEWEKLNELMPEWLEREEVSADV